MRIVPMGSIGPHNSPSKSCFLTPREKKRILTSSSYSPYGFASLGRITTIRVYPSVTRPWRFSDHGVPSFNFGNSLVSHVQWLDENPTVDRLSLNTSGRTPTHNFCITINNLSNQFLFTLNDCTILEPVYWTCYFLSLTPLRIYKYQNLVRGPFLTPVSLPELSSTFIPFLRNFPYRTS